MDINLGWTQAWTSSGGEIIRGRENPPREAALSIRIGFWMEFKKTENSVPFHHNISWSEMSWKEELLHLGRTSSESSLKDPVESRFPVNHS